MEETDEKSVQFLSAKCEVCGGSDREDLILLCDGKNCNLEFHTFCLRPPIVEIPEGDWFCPLCSDTGTNTDLIEKVLNISNENESRIMNDSFLSSNEVIGCSIRIYLNEGLLNHVGRIIGVRKNNNSVEHLIQFKR
jgi:hypothetical protein